MRADGSRKKKLIVAFHFYRAGEAGSMRAGWDCEQCRRLGLESRRRCGFILEDRRGASRVVWARGRVGVNECPKSLVCAESLEFVEKYLVWKFAGGAVEDRTAREVDAFLTLEEEMRREMANGE